MSWYLQIRQWPHDNSTSWAHCVQLHIACANDPKKAQKVKQRA